MGQPFCLPQTSPFNSFDSNYKFNLLVSLHSQVFQHWGLRSLRTLDPNARHGQIRLFFPLREERSLPGQKVVQTSDRQPPTPVFDVKILLSIFKFSAFTVFIFRQWSFCCPFFWRPPWWTRSPSLQSYHSSGTYCTGCFFSFHYKLLSRLTIYVNVDSPIRLNLGFPYFNFLGGYQ